MTTQILPSPARALDANVYAVPAAVAEFYDTGTTTPRTVYASDGTTPLGTTVTADAAGMFPQVFTPLTTGVKVVVKDADGAVLYTVDPCILATVAGQGAADITFTPITGNAADDVQEAIANATGQINRITTPGWALLEAESVAAQRTVLGLGGLAVLNILDEDDMASNSATTPPSQQSVIAYIAARFAALTPIYTSSQQTITAAGYLNLTHGLGAEPSWVSLTLVCTSDDIGFTAGERIEIGIGHDSSGSSGLGIGVRKSASAIGVQFGSATDVVRIMRMDGANAGNDAPIDPAKWALVVRAGLR